MPVGESERRYYPGLIEEETRLWRRWLRLYERDFVAFEYNVRVGQGVRVPRRAITGDPVLDEQFRELFRQWTQRKVDVLGFKGPETWIIEVEERPSTRALGQLLAYQELLPDVRPNVGPVQLALVCVFLGPDMLRVVEAQDILVFQLGRE